MAEVRFLEMMQLEPHGPDTFVGTGPQYPWGGLYGGQIIAQGLRAAALTVDSQFRLHSLHAYFIRLGDASQPIRFEVDRIRNGRSFVTRRVVVRQAAGAILNMSASFHVPEDGPYVQTERLPEVDLPDTLTEDSWSPLFGRRSLRDDIAAGRVGAWLRLTEDLGDDPVLNACALAYLSDDLPTEAVVARHPQRPPRDATYRSFWNASLDHSIWFHQPLRADAWHLHDFTCRGLVRNLGTSVGSIFDEAGRHVATVAQEVLIRPAREDQP
jgi:acyl-CoA thioesterase-2